jgi:hypothetical protein
MARSMAERRVLGESEQTLVDDASASTGLGVPEVDREAMRARARSKTRPTLKPSAE